MGLVRNDWAFHSWQTQKILKGSKNTWSGLLLPTKFFYFWLGTTVLEFLSWLHPVRISVGSKVQNTLLLLLWFFSFIKKTQNVLFSPLSFPALYPYLPHKFYFLICLACDCFCGFWHTVIFFSLVCFVIFFWWFHMWFWKLWRAVLGILSMMPETELRR